MASPRACVDIPKWAPVAVLALTALIYSRALGNGFASLDDDVNILQNPLIRNFSVDGLKRIFSGFYNSNYHPLTTIAYLFEYSLFGLRPLPYHLLNVLLHLINTWLVFQLIEKLSGQRVAAFVTSFLFAVHPMHVESVAWASEQKDVLYACFYFLSLLFYLRYAGLRGQAKDLVRALLFFVASLLCKSAAVTLPVLLTAIDVYRRRKIDAKSMLEKIPFYLLALLFGILAILSQRAGHAINADSLRYGLIEKISVIAYAVAFYIVKLAAPFGLSVMHFYPEGALPWQYYAALPFVLFIGWALSRPHAFRRETAFGVSFFLITVSVMLQIIPVGIAVAAERYTYVPYVGLFYVVGQWVAHMEKTPLKKIALAGICFLAMMFGVQTWARNGVWKDGESLFNDVVKKYPDNHYGYWLRGNIRYHQGALFDALRDYNKALELNPRYATAYVNRGCVYNMLNDYKDALQDLNRAISMDTTMAEAYNNRGWAYYALGDKKSALPDYNRAILLNPAYAEAYNNRGWAYYELDNRAAAMEDFNKAVESDPSFTKAYYNRGALMVRMGNFMGAIGDYDYLLRLNPKDGAAHYNRGLSRFSVNDQAGACEDLKEAVNSGFKAAAELAGRYCR